MSLGLSYPNWHLFLALPCILFYTALVARRLNDIRGLSMAKYIWGIFWIWVIICYPFRTAAGIYNRLHFTKILLLCQGENDASDKQIRLHKKLLRHLCLLLSFLYFDDNGFAFPSLPTFPQAVFPILALLQNGYSMSRRRQVHLLRQYTR